MSLALGHSLGNNSFQTCNYRVSWYIKLYVYVPSSYVKVNCMPTS
jgi:hypothetical protein